MLVEHSVTLHSDTTEISPHVLTPLNRSVTFRSKIFANPKHCKFPAHWRQIQNGVYRKICAQWPLWLYFGQHTLVFSLPTAAMLRHTFMRSFIPMTFLCHPRRVNYWLTQWVGGTSFVVQLKSQGFAPRHIRFPLKTPRMKLKKL